VPIPLRHLIVAAVLAGCTVAHAQAPRERVRMQDYAGIGNILGYVAIKNGYCHKHGIECELKVLPSAPLGVQMVLSGDLDIAITNAEVLFNAVARGSQLRVLGAINVLPMTFLVGGNHLQIPQASMSYPAIMHELKGKRIGVTARGSGSEFQVLAMLKGAGLSAADVTLVPVGPPETALPALTSRQVDAVMSFEPMGAFCTVQRSCRMLVDVRKGEGPAVLQQGRAATTLQVVRAEFARRKPQVVTAVRAAMADAEKFAQDPANYQRMLAIMRDKFPLERPDAEQVRDSVLRESLPAERTHVDRQVLQAAADALVSTGQLTAPIDAGPLLTLN
jgi:NitT/TauT family transport system substrate-binding protein